MIYLLLYNFIAIPIVYSIFFICSFFSPKLKEVRTGRKNLFEKLKNDIEKFKDREKVFVHSTSVGEWEQAIPVINKIKEKNPNLVVVVSFFSPSGYNYMKKKKFPNVDVKTYLPVDFYFSAKKFLKIIKPKFWIVSKFDAWPNHIYVAGKQNIPIFLISATLSITTRRDKGFAKLLNRYIYKNFTHIFPISFEDGERFKKLFPYDERVTIAGDTRFDSVYQKTKNIEKEKFILKYKKEDIVLTLGSIWQEDEKHLLPAIKELLNRHKNLKIIVAPHELIHIETIKKKLKAIDIKCEKFSLLKKGFAPDVVLLDKIGVLAKLYSISNMAYIGGSFGFDGIHNTMEPAVFGNLVFFGPNFQNSFEAQKLIEKKGAFVVKNKIDIIELVENYIDGKDDMKREAGKIAKNYIESSVGAGEKIINIIKEKYGLIS